MKRREKATKKKKINNKILSKIISLKFIIFKEKIHAIG